MTNLKFEVFTAERNVFIAIVFLTFYESQSHVSQTLIQNQLEEVIMGVEGPIHLRFLTRKLYKSFNLCLTYLGGAGKL